MNYKRVNKEKALTFAKLIYNADINNIEIPIMRPSFKTLIINRLKAAKKAFYTNYNCDYGNEEYASTARYYICAKALSILEKS